MRVWVAILFLAVMPGPASAKNLPDLHIVSGTASASGGTLTSSFVVKNTGRRRAGRSTAALAFRRGTQRFPGATAAVRALAPGATATVNMSFPVPGGLPTGALQLRACADSRGAVRERSETNNCRVLGTFTGGSAAPRPMSSVPENPVAYEAETPLKLSEAESDYWVDVPSTYDASHQTPVPLLVWLHGCGGDSAGDIYSVSPGGTQDWISIAVGGRDADCWKPSEDGPKVFAAIADVKTHFNIDPRRVILGGYSSGGDLAYRTAFYNSAAFAGVLAENTSPFRDTESSQADSLAAATTKFHVVHLAHTEDKTYAIDGVRAETDAMKAAGFPIERVERPGTHYDDDTANSGTNHDLRAILLPHIDDGWTSP